MLSWLARLQRPRQQRQCTRSREWWICTPGIPLEGRGGDVVVVADADDGGIGIEAGQDRISNRSCRSSSTRLELRSRTTRPQDRSADQVEHAQADEERRVADRGHQRRRSAARRSAGRRCRTCRPCPATVATSFLRNRSEDIVITVTDSVWCAKPPRLRSAIAAYGLSTKPTKATPIIRHAPTVKAQRRALIRLRPRRF